jgi:hypothetical protein
VDSSVAEASPVYRSRDHLQHVEGVVVAVEEDIDRIEDHSEDYRMDFVALVDEDLDHLGLDVAREVEEVIPHHAILVFQEQNRMDLYYCMSEVLEENPSRKLDRDSSRLEVFRFQDIEVRIFEAEIDRDLLLASLMK